MMKNPMKSHEKHQVYQVYQVDDPNSASNPLQAPQLDLLGIFVFALKSPSQTLS